MMNLTLRLSTKLIALNNVISVELGQSSKSGALKFARKMTDEQNRNSALNFLKKKPSKKNQ